MRNEGPIISSAPLADERGGKEKYFFFEDGGERRWRCRVEIGRREGKGGRLLQASEEKGGRGQKKKKKSKGENLTTRNKRAD